MLIHKLMELDNIDWTSWYSSGENLDGYLAEVNFIDGQALAPI
jgi:hypothetical protein